MIFCQTRKTASWLVEKMTKDGHAVALLSGELTVEERIQVLDRFRDGLEKILITTNVMARGIDIEQVINIKTATTTREYKCNKAISFLDNRFSCSIASNPLVDSATG